MASDLSGTGKVGSGYGGGGVGGGEYASDKFSSSSAGANGAVYIIEMRVKACEVLPHILVNHNNANHKIACIKPTKWMDINDTSYNYTQHSKLFVMYDPGFRYIANMPTRSFNKSPSFTIQDDLNGQYAEFVNIGNFKNCTLCESKVKHNEVSFKTLYFTDDDPTTKTYPYEIVTHSFTSTGSSSGTLGSSDCSALYLYVLVQGAGGGGGGGDNNWGLFNYAAGGGGGGGGGAIAARVYVPKGTVKYSVTVGKGGSGGASGNHDGSAANGAVGGMSSVYFTDVDTSSKYTGVYASGGYYGTKPGKDTNGTGGAGGDGAVTEGTTTFDYVILYNVKGGKGANQGTGGTASAYVTTKEEVWSNINLFTVKTSVTTTVGSGGTVGSQNDRGGGGGSSWLGNGGYY